MKVALNVDLNLKKLSINDEKWFSKLTYHVGISDLSFPLLYAYRNFLNIECMRLDEKTALLVQDDAYGKRCYTILGDVNESIIRELTALGINEFSYVIAAQLPIFNSIKGMKWDIKYDIDFSDYVYDLDKFLILSKKARKEYNYYKNHHQPKLVEINNNNWEDSYKVVKLWSKFHQKTHVFGDEVKAYGEIKKLIGHPKVKGSILYDQGVPVSVKVVEERGEMLVNHFMKTSISARGLAKFFYHNFHWQFQGKIKWVNLGEDMGLSGLRQFKQRMHPVFLLHKYTVKLIS
ncbi:MAG: phosphatidylglycerol lysyltransferase domain-containing protein [Streptococcaceae bacterium]|jgi:hypothetical protein|nr:phosphatidylglycerol lysyltransferase domain-containing protein [Streptococcaceae bacterium]